MIDLRKKTMKNRLRSSILLLLAAWLVTACIDQTVYHTYQSIPSKGWGKGDTLFFHVPLTDSLVRLHLYAEVRNESEYTYQNLYLVIGNNLADSTCFRTDTLEFTLADSEGKWKGTGWGTLYQSSLPLDTAIVRHPGNYTFKINHGMKDEILIGICDIGIRIDSKTTH